jgi:two-component system sensor histidine kinase YesM
MVLLSYTKGCLRLRKHRHTTIKSRIILIMTVFALLTAALMSIFSYEMISYFQRKTAVQAAEFNLQLVAHIIEKDLINLSAHVMKNSANSTTNTLLVDYFSSEQASAMDAINLYASMQEDFRSNLSNGYVRRLVVTDNKNKFLQVDNLASSTSLPLSIHNIHLLPGTDSDAAEQWGRIIKDPYSNSKVIPVIFPIYDKGSTVGTVYLLAGTSVITDKLHGYALPSGSQLLVTLGETHYEIDGAEIEPVVSDYVDTAFINDYSTGSQTVVSHIESKDGSSRITVSYPVIDGVVLTQTLATNQLTTLSNVWILLMLGVSCLLIALSGIITVYLTRTISNPVEKLKKRMDKIAQGHFFVDRMIEWDNELGDVGRGINRLSQDIVALMETRLADEKQKQELEYRMLQSQINPHFLYNTLNSIKWMATIQNASGIAEMTTSLSRLLRNIAKDIRKLVPLGEELALLDDYFLIQKYRYGSTITLEQHIGSEQLLNCPIPRFSLQPIVENAIFHGIEPKGTGGHIVITVERSDSADLLITIEDNGIGMEQEKIDAILKKHDTDSAGMITHMGLSSVNERLRLAFGDKYGLSIESEPSKYTKMFILLPTQTSA